MSSSTNSSELPGGWSDVLVAGGFDLQALYADLDTLYLAHARAISPRRRDAVFRAFHRTPLVSTRVVILGEDPYPNPDHANGLAFSTPGGFRGPHPVSLSRIFGSLRRDLKIRPVHGDLTPWADRGVLLANVALTHQIGATSPDLARWADFTGAVLSAVRDLPHPVAWLAWGDFANDQVDAIGIDVARHFVLRNAHPRAGRAKRKTLAQSPPFAAASKFLGSNPYQDWAL